MSELSFAILDVDGHVLRRPSWHQDGSVTITLNDAREGQLTVSLFDESAEFTALANLLLVYYEGRPILKAPIVNPEHRASDGTATIHARDIVKLERRFLRFGHVSVATGYSMDGSGVNVILTDANPDADQIAAGVKTHGFVEGPNSTTVWTGPKLKAERGANVWETITSLMGMHSGPDVDFVPVDGANPPSIMGYEDGMTAEYRTSNFQGVDRTDPTSTSFLRLAYGSAEDNLDDFTAGPNTDLFTNYAVAVNAAGETTSADSTNRRLARDVGSWLEVGIYEDWTSESNSTLRSSDEGPFLQEVADATIENYGGPPETLSLDLAPEEQEGVPKYLTDFLVGDRIAVDVRRGWFAFSGPARIVAVTLTQRQGGGTETSVEVVPVVTKTATEGE